MLLRALILLCLLLPSSLSPAAESVVLFREDFATLDNWKPFFFPKIKTHSTYTIERDGDRHVLRAESNASASALVYRESFDVYQYPRARWRWRVRNVYVKADPRSKAGDDYPMRVYIMFEYDPEKAGVMDRITYGIAKSLYGEYPPHSSLSYVWASRDDASRFVVSPYTERAMMVLLEMGPARAGTWEDEEIDIVADYQQAFGTKPPARARIAVMNDSDNTGESSVSWMEHLEVSK
jgi:hypothetical protein